MRRCLTLLAFVAMTANLPGDVVDLAPERGRAVASINWTDETGRARQLSEFVWLPAILFRSTPVVAALVCEMSIG